MNDESLQRVNAFLAAVASRTEVGEVLAVTPAEIGRELGFPDPLSTARAVRALIARERLEPAQGSYRLLEVRPVEPGEKVTPGRATRSPRRGPRGGRDGGERSGSVTYSDLGRAAVDRLVELGRDVGGLRASLRTAREEAHEARQARDEAEGRARLLTAKVRDLEARAEMAESNLRTLLATARGNEGSSGGGAVTDSEMEAILGVLKGGEAIPDAPASETPSRSDVGPDQPPDSSGVPPTSPGASDA
jgi:hypothetical protein